MAEPYFWLGREAEQPMLVWQDERGCIAERVRIKLPGAALWRKSAAATRHGLIRLG